MIYLLLILGFILLIKGADLFVSGSSGLAKFFKIPPIIIGLTIVAFGTSAPEAAVSISAAIKGSESISVGNIVGSNLINISLIIGITACIFPLKVERATIRKEIPLALLGSIALLILILDKSLQNSLVSSLSRADGLILLSFFSVFLYYIIEVALKSQNNGHYLLNETHSINIKKATIQTILGLGGIILGGWLVVENAKSIALSLGMSETLVGLTIVAIGTSLPEMVTAITAALKKESEIALGNIIGSNIFNILFVLGISATITELVVESKILFDVLLMIGLTLLLLIFSTTHQRKINRTEGLLLSIVYVAYIIFIIIRN
ncbi:calcium/sodium antiporter [Hujiaoplasma nucleasis]|uniref:Calcium/sodium antiporter n=1 Tax=Hujiaoplasma nucleasis TaxID=2725268 RepID=A0A7L6N4G7_9MOLU|nr:calcium/sodium antiporter [Hujiaoplasma nucleasis]QLY40138.1 calcium/sodium antiporter [Hujiaoplasma nucleasis]